MVACVLVVWSWWSCWEDGYDEMGEERGRALPVADQASAELWEEWV
jgi:hypothetical protein